MLYLYYGIQSGVEQKTKQKTYLLVCMVCHLFTVVVEVVCFYNQSLSGFYMSMCYEL